MGISNIQIWPGAAVSCQVDLSRGFYAAGVIHAPRWFYSFVCHSSSATKPAAADASLWLDSPRSHYTGAGLMKAMCLLCLFQSEMQRKRMAQGLEMWWRTGQHWQHLMFRVSSLGRPAKDSELWSELSSLALVSTWPWVCGDVASTTATIHTENTTIILLVLLKEYSVFMLQVICVCFTKCGLGASVGKLEDIFSCYSYRFPIDL